MNKDTTNQHLRTAAWIIILIFSLIPNILWRELTGQDDRWLLWVKLGLLAALLIISFFWKFLQPLRKFLIILLAIYGFEEIIARVSQASFWQAWFGGAGISFGREMMSQQLQRLAVSLLIILVLMGLGLRRKDFFLTSGNLKAPITPVRWLGFPNPDPWTRFGGQFAVYISLGLLVFLILGGRPTPAALTRALPILPAVLLLAAMNALMKR